MRRYIIGRVLQAVVTLFVISMLVFGLVRVSGDPALLMLPYGATEEDYQELRADLGLDKPVIIQYGIFVREALKGNFGDSILTDKAVSASIGEMLPNSAKLVGVSMLMAILVSIPFGVIAAVRKNSVTDYFVRLLAGLGQSVPNFWVGVMMIQIFVVKFNILPSSGMGTWKHYLMPASCLAVFMVAGLVRLLRSSMLEALDSEYIKLARIKGVSEMSINWKHALKNSMLPVLSFGGMYVAILITGAILIETVFAWPGIGRLAYSGIVNQDFPVIQGAVLTAAVITMTANLVTDILYGYLDPRIRYYK